MNDNFVQFGFTDEEMIEPRAIGCNLHKELKAIKPKRSSSIRHHGYC